jgi:hypothetical protein
MELTQEQWADLPNMNGYQVSTRGQVKSPDYRASWNPDLILRKGRILIHRLVHGYPTISIKIEGKRKHLSIHRLVALAFVPNPNNLPWVNHKDGNKANNNPENLEWCTPSYNLYHAYKIGLQPRGSKKFSAKLDELQVRTIKSLQADSNLSHVQIANYFKVSAKTIGSIAQGKKWKHIDLNEYKLAA